MKDGNSVVANCLILRQDITSLLSQAERLIESLRDASQDLRHLSDELASLHLSVGAIQISYGQISNIPITLTANLRSVLAGCGSVVKEIHDVLDQNPFHHPSAESSSVRRSQPGLRKLLPSLEAHKSAIQIALELLLVVTTEAPSVQSLSSSDVGHSSPQHHLTVSIDAMLREIRVLQFQVAQLSQAYTVGGSDSTLQRFLADVSEYTESIQEDSGAGSSKPVTAQDTDNPSDTDDFHSARESFIDPSQPTSQNDNPSPTDDHLEQPPSLPPSTILTSTSPSPPPPPPLPLPHIPPILPSSSSLSEHSAWSYTSIRLRLSNRLYSVRTAPDTTRNIISAMSFIDPAIRAVRLARQQGVVPLSDAHKAQIDFQIRSAEQALDHAASLVEHDLHAPNHPRGPRQVVRKVRFVLRDAVRLTAAFDRLRIAGVGLNAAANVLYGVWDGGGGSRLPSAAGVGAEEDDGWSVSSLNIPAPPYCLSFREGNGVYN